VKVRRYLSSALLLAGAISTGVATLAQTTVPGAPVQTSYTETSAAADTPRPQPSESEIPLGPVLPENIKLTESLVSPNAVTDWAAAHRLRFFGWANGGYTWSSIGSGLLRVEPRENRFGDEWIVDQAAFVLERTLNEAGDHVVVINADSRDAISPKSQSCPHPLSNVRVTCATPFIGGYW